MKKRIALFLALALSCMILVPSRVSAADSSLSAAVAPSEPLSDEVLAETYSTLYALDSLHMDMDVTVEMNMAVTYSGQPIKMPMSILMRVEVDEQQSPVRIRGRMSMDANIMGTAQQQSALLYGEQADGLITAYTSVDDGASWTAEQSEAPTVDPVQTVTFIVDHSRDFHATGKELVDGKETVVYTGKMNGSFLQQAMSVTGSDAMSDLMGEGMTEADLDGLGDIDVTMYIDTEAHLPRRYTMDMSALMKNLMSKSLQSMAGAEDLEAYEMDIEINTAKVDCCLKDFNAVAPIEIPEAARASFIQQPEPLPVVGDNTADTSASIPCIEFGEGYRIEKTQIQETVLVDDEYVRIVGKSLSYDPDDLHPYVDLDLSIENKTVRKLTVTNNLLLVNGFDLMGSMFEKVEPGATIESSLSLDEDVLRCAKIPMIADLWVSFTVSSEDYSLIVETPVAKLRTDAPADFVQTIDTTGFRLYDDHGVVIVARYLEPGYGGSADLILLIENGTDNYVYYSTKAVRINGIDVDLFGNELLSPQSNAIHALYIDGDALKAQNIQQVDTVSLQLRIQIHDEAFTDITTDFIDFSVIY